MPGKLTFGSCRRVRGPGARRRGRAGRHGTGAAVTTFEGPRVDEVDGVGALTLGGFLDEVTTRFGQNEAVVLDDPMRGCGPARP